MTLRCCLLLGCAALASISPTRLQADVKLARLFSDRAVLQRDRELPVWGWADPGETVRVSLGQKQAETVADARGKWTVRLAPQPLSKQPLTLKVVGRKTVEVRDVLLGDVWLCSGQSNMDFPLGACDAAADIQAADFPLIRQFGVALNFAQNPQTDVVGDWQTCTPQHVPGFSAVGFYFARKVCQETGVPIGILRSSVGGTNIECWMSQETLLNTPELEPFAKLMRQSLADYQVELAAALPDIEAWVTRSREAVRTGQAIPLPPTWPEFPFGERRFRPRCVTLHNGMIAPLIPISLKGALWYQGENNAGGPQDGEQYIAKTRALVRDWRQWFGNPDLPFYFVQLAAWQQPHNNPELADGWAFFRDAQRRCLSIPHTGMASAVDVGDADDIHPKNKLDVGERLARWALAEEYGQKLESSGPLFRKLVIEGHAARLQFDHVGSGLMIGRKVGRTSVTPEPQGQLQRFAIAGADRQWRWATAVIDGDTVVCSHPDVPNPVAIRYAFSMNPAGANLYNREGLPASPFRTDDW
ncbi:MAG: sialate O-acetylesterase [Planctomycetes bacterium]|nr:sialate O-acetylesterase [Planctomycetota bacterium]